MGIGFEIQGLRTEIEIEAQWSYSGFNRFRHRLAEAVGIELDTMRGYGKWGSWKKHKDEPLVRLLNHSDSGGRLTPAECARIAPRLRKVLGRSEFRHEIYPRDRIHGLDLARGMEKAARLKRPLVFC